MMQRSFSGACGAAPQQTTSIDPERRIRDVPESISDLSGVTNQLRDAIDKLEARLNTVVRYKPQADVEKEGLCAPRCELSQEINNAVGSLRDTRDRLLTLLDSIEL